MQTDTPAPFFVAAGKRYVLRNNAVTGYLSCITAPKIPFPFHDPHRPKLGGWDDRGNSSDGRGLDIVAELASSGFVYEFREVAKRAHEVNVANGWWDDRHAYLRSGLPNAGVHTFCALVGLVHTELSEAIEAARKHPPEQWRDASTKDTMVRELAGAVVRIMDIAASYQLPLAEAVLAEIEANGTRGHRHGGKAA